MPMICKLISSLEKIFSDGRGTDVPSPRLTALKGESISFQAALKNEEGNTYLWPRIDSPLKDYITVRRVESVPVRIPRSMENSDEDYISLEPGMYPDVLMELNGAPAMLPTNQWRSLWVEVAVPQDAPAGNCPVTLTLHNAEGEEKVRLEAVVEVIDAVLPKQTIVHTEWFHSDCLADYYNVPAFSEEHWKIVENFVRTAAKRGCNMLLTPHVTPALDTRVGGERTTVQLVGVTVENGQYSFDFTNLKRWMDMALDCGMEYFEMAHLFTQWGAKAAPKVMATKDGEYTRIFGWDTPAVGGEYTNFLHAYLPQLIAKIKEWGMAERCYFHISDEPVEEQLEYYKAARESLEGMLDGFPIMDAMSHYPIYKESNIQRAVVSIWHLHAFLEKEVAPLWGYYCCGPTTVMTNRFLQMTLHRTRALGVQLWNYNLAGFLHWGYNFYNTQYSVDKVNPYLDTEAGGAFPAGDGFIVYPGRTGKPDESIRLMAMHSAFQDAQALQLLESLVGREKAMEVLQSQGEISLASYPKTGEGMLNLRNAINDAIAAAVK